MTLMLACGDLMATERLYVSCCDAAAVPNAFRLREKGRDIAFDCKVRSPNNVVTEAAALDYLSCVSYLQGFTEGAYFCVPVGVTPTDLAAVVVKYGDDHPERLYLERGAFVKEAIDSAYPCKR